MDIKRTPQEEAFYLAVLEALGQKPGSAFGRTKATSTLRAYAEAGFPYSAAQTARNSNLPEELRHQIEAIYALIYGG